MVVTMKDVANHAGVSKSTVSQYLNNRFQYMSEQTKKKIENSIKELNYTPNQIARSLKQKKTNVIAIVAATLSSRFTTELISTIEKFFSDKGIDVIVASTDDNPSKEKKYVEALKARQVDGLIVFPTVANRSYYQQLFDEGYPIVFMDRKIDDLNIDSITLDNFAAGFMAAEYLVKKNHRNIAILTFPLGEKESITNRRDRLNGYLSVLKKNNISVEKKYIVQTNRKDIATHLDGLMKLITPPSALILTNDMLLEDTLVWAKENEIDLPDRLSLISIDDVSFAHFFTPAITTIAQPVAEMGTMAAALLLKKTYFPERKLKIRNIYDPQIKIRESVKKI
ncbi:LacI family DNA-binding transcriptional regulator [Enterococcus massiliensis]|uniref:LacI family DNA-binding transcriptional regulator n=1 Tax=Enterococcus massiliensis TaxID=1640685 RepID=UPI00065E6C54|nr:LacI family DNA-binding transcriptional regulator [Enterococcus massiliensis]